MNENPESSARLNFVTREGKSVLRCTARVASSWGSRLEGLLLTRAEDASPLLLVDCPSIHTVGMRYPIDVALIGDGQVLRAERGVRPGRIVHAKGASWALERPSSSEPWPTRGDMVRLTTCSKRGWATLLSVDDSQVAEVA